MGSILLRLRTWWETADRTQRVVTVFGSAFLGILLLGTFYFASKPKMALAYSGLEPKDQGLVVSEIQKLGIPVEYDVQGNVRVPSDRIAEVQASLAKAGFSPSSGHPGSKDLSNIGMISPQSVIDKQLVAVRQGEIAATLESINGVAAARVLLNMGTKQAFSSEDDPPSVSVTLTEESGFDLSGMPAKSMAQLVARAVPGLTIKHVTIVNQDGQTLFDGSETEGLNGLSADKIAAQRAEAARIKRELQPILDRFGPGNTVMTVRVDMDFDKKSQRSVKIKPHDQPLSLTEVSEVMSGSAAGGSNSAAGTVANSGQPGFSPAGSDDGKKNDSYNATQADKQFPFDQTTTDTEKAPGAIKQLAISVIVNSNPGEGQDPIDRQAVEDALKGYLGTAMLGKSDFSVTVTEAKFDDSEKKALKAAAATAAGRDRNQQLLTYLPIAALVLVAGIVLKALKKVASSTDVVMQVTPDGRTIAVPVSAGALGKGISALPASGDVEDEWEEVDEVDPDRPDEPPKRKRRKKKAQLFEEDEDDPVLVGKISEKVNVPLEQLKKMAGQKPDAIAMLLKSWLVEERR